MKKEGDFFMYFCPGCDVPPVTRASQSKKRGRPRGRGRGRGLAPSVSSSSDEEPTSVRGRGRGRGRGAVVALPGAGDEEQERQMVRGRGRGRRLSAGRIGISTRILGSPVSEPIDYHLKIIYLKFISGILIGAASSF